MKRTAALVLWLLPALCGAAEDEIACAGVPLSESPQRVIWNEGQVQPLGDRIRLCTYNMENFTDGRWDGFARWPSGAKRQARSAADLLNRIRPDIVILQEVEDGRALGYLNGGVEPPFPVGYITRFANRNGEREKLNMAVLSRLPLGHVRELDFGTLEGKGCPPRGMLRFSVDLGKGSALLVYAVHLKSNWGDAARNRAKRRSALELLRADAGRLVAASPVTAWEIVVAGDMNTDPEAAGFENDPTLEPMSDWLDLWRGRPLAERVTLPTRHGDPALEFPPATFDRVIVSPELRDEPWVVAGPTALQEGVNTSDSHAVAGRDPSHVSDHYPVYVDILRGE